ncbi:MAG: hypothetical protein D6713_03460 [Deltaproteobacteria bacterium]|nr:MAG: hypothetical protein D6713_03460 [Deltaproteobacteria bacterium]
MKGPRSVTRRKSAVVFALFLSLTLFLPLAGAFLTGFDLSSLSTFPPEGNFQGNGGVSIPFTLFAFAVGTTLLLVFILTYIRGYEGRARERNRFPRWGWGGVLFLLGAWVLAWTRFDWFAPLQRHTFTPLWLGYICVATALSEKLHGTSPAREDPLFFISLFPASSLFWWIFEFLNRFVGNWEYRGLGTITAGEYVALASVSFSTVLPAVETTSFLFRGYLGEERVRNSGVVKEAVLPSRRWMTYILLFSGAVTLFLIPVFPQFLYPFLWISPVLIVGPLTSIAGLSPDEGDPVIASYGLAALVCGFFWETWNWKSLAHWVYHVPLVPSLKLFEMPLPGYFGYLPFGVECFLFIVLVKYLVRGDL